jgi:hypothetical protein
MTGEVTYRCTACGQTDEVVSWADFPHRSKFLCVILAGR